LAWDLESFDLTHVHCLLQRRFQVGCWHISLSDRHLVLAGKNEKDAYAHQICNWCASLDVVNHEHLLVPASANPSLVLNNLAVWAGLDTELHSIAQDVGSWRRIDE
jgi:hypothetical protein